MLVYLKRFDKKKKRYCLRLKKQFWLLQLKIFFGVKILYKR